MAIIFLQQGWSNRVMKNILAIVMITYSSAGFSEGVSTKLCIKNEADKAYYAYGVDVDSYDWQDVDDDNGMRRPDHQWVGEPIRPSETLCRRLDFNFNQFSTGPRGFGMLLMDNPSLQLISAKTRMRLMKEKTSNGGEIRRWYIDKSTSPNPNTPGRLSGSGSITVYEKGYPCADKKDPLFRVCSLFVIRN